MGKAEILIVEDETIIGMDVKATLESFDYNVPKIICKGEEAIEYVQNNPPDLTLMDIILAGDLDGITTAEQIRYKYNIPTVFMTAQANIHVLKKAYDCLPYGYVLKPINDMDLVYTIDTALLRFRVEDELRRENENLSRMNKLLKNIILHMKNGNKLNTNTIKRDDSINISSTLNWLFETIDVPAALCQVFYDKGGEPVNYEIQEYNTKFSEEIYPKMFTDNEIEENVPPTKSSLLTKFHQILKTCEPVHFQSDFATHENYHISAYSYDKEHLFLIFNPCI